jgi:hypothetical protein
MTKKIVTLLAAFTTIGLISYIVYKQYAPAIIAHELLKETEPVFLPKKIVEKIKKIKVQTNQLSTDVIKDIHKSNITLDQILKALDEVTEDKANLLLDEINGLGVIKSSDQIFDLTKKHFPVDFDVEPLREPFRNKADVRLLQKAVQKANEYRDNSLIDFESAKAIAKRILIEKEKEFNQYIEPN